MYIAPWCANQKPKEIHRDGIDLMFLQKESQIQRIQ